MSTTQPPKSNLSAKCKPSLSIADRLSEIHASTTFSLSPKGTPDSLKFSLGNGSYLEFPLPPKFSPPIVEETLRAVSFATNSSPNAQAFSFGFPRSTHPIPRTEYFPPVESYFSFPHPESPIRSTPFTTNLSKPQDELKKASLLPTIHANFSLRNFTRGRDRSPSTASTQPVPTPSPLLTRHESKIPAREPDKRPQTKMVPQPSLSDVKDPPSQSQHTRDVSAFTESTTSSSAFLPTPTSSLEFIDPFWAPVFSLLASPSSELENSDAQSLERLGSSNRFSVSQLHRTLRFSSAVDVISPEDESEVDEPPDFDEYRRPTTAELKEASFLHVISETGDKVSFGSLFKERKTIVCFIRHFWCPLCQDYMFSISRNLKASALHDHDVDLVIISNGSHEMIKAYRRIFRTPFAVYTDPSLEVYIAMGMTRQTLEKGPKAYKGSYVRHGTMSGIGMVVKNAVANGMPLFEKGGPIDQLGGEFILGPGLEECAFAHRMRYTRDHIPILDLVKKCGIDLVQKVELVASESESTSLVGPEVGIGAQGRKYESWKNERKKELEKLRSKKAMRREGMWYCDGLSCTSAVPSVGKDEAADVGHVRRQLAVDWSPWA